MLAVVLALGDVDPTRRVAGLPLVLRTALDLQARGADRLVVATESRHLDAVTAALRDERLPLEWTVVSSERDALPTAIARLCDGPVLWGRHDLCVDPAAYQPVAIPNLADLPDLDDVDAPDLSRAAWHVRIASEADEERASDALFEACRKPVDGIVSRHLNRHVSLWLSRRMVDLPISPNAITVVVFAIALAAAWLALDPRHASTAAAGVLMQLSSILDGCDGELARVRHQGSRLGQWLDTVGDDLSNVLFWAALGVGASALPEHGRWLAIGGYTTAACNGLAALINYRLLVAKGSGDFYALMPRPAPAVGLGGRVVALFGVILKQDFFLFLVMLLALAGVLHWATPLLALGAAITLGAALVRLASQPKSK